MVYRKPLSLNWEGLKKRGGEVGSPKEIRENRF